MEQTGYTRKTYMVIGYADYSFANGPYRGCCNKEEKVDSSLRDLPAEEIIRDHIERNSYIKPEEVFYFYFYDVFEAEIIFEGKKITLTSSKSGRKWGLNDHEENVSGMYFNGGILYSAKECQKELNIDPHKNFVWFSEELESVVWFPTFKESFRFRKDRDVIVKMG